MKTICPPKMSWSGPGKQGHYIHKLTQCSWAHIHIMCIWEVGTQHDNTQLHACLCKYLSPLPNIDLKHPAITEGHIISFAPHHHQDRVRCKVTIRVMKTDSRMADSSPRPTRTTTCYSCPHLQMKNVFHGEGASMTFQYAFHRYKPGVLTMFTTDINVIWWPPVK